MAPPPPLRYRSILTGLSPLSLGVADTSAAGEMRESTEAAAVASGETSAARRSASMTGLVTEGGEAHRRHLLAQPFARAEVSRLETLLPTLLERAREGNRRSYYDAMMVSFVAVHSHLESDHRDRAHAVVQRFRDLSRDYLHYFQNDESMGAEDKLRYLFAAMRVVRTMLDRVEEDGDFSERYAADLSDLRSLMTDMLGRLREYHQAFLLSNPTATHLTGIHHEIELRLAVLQDRPADARQAAMHLVEFYRVNPPGEAVEANPETTAWHLNAARELLGDPEMEELLSGLDTPSSAEDSAMMVNAMTLELLQVIGVGLDAVNEEEPETIQSRYQAFGAIATTLILAVPGISVPEILSMLLDPEQTETLSQLLEAVSEESSQVEEILNAARGEQSLESLLNRARAAAEHLHEWETGPGHDIIEQLFYYADGAHRIHLVGQFLRNHPELAENLGYDRTKLEIPAFQRNYAVDLLRRGSTAEEIIEAYSARHPEDPVGGLLTHLRSTASAGETLNGFVGELLRGLEGIAEQQPDHGVSVLHALFQTIVEMEELAPGVALDAESRGRARILVDQYESFGFRAWRIFDHLTSGESLAVMGIGILGPWLAEAAALSRAGSAGRLSLPFIGEVVNAGRMAPRGALLLGAGSGVAMSAVGSFLHNRRRERMGFSTHYLRDFGEGAVINGLTFGLTLRFSRWRAAGLGRIPEEGMAVGRMAMRTATRLSLETAMVGGTLAYGLGYGYRGARTGNWSWSWDEVAENYLSVLAWEMGSAGARRIRSYGVGAELRGRPLMEAIPIETPERAGRLRRGYDGVRRGLRTGIAGFGNLLFTGLGPHTASRVNDVADMIVHESPDALGPHREFIARQLGLQELASPGSIGRYNERFFDRYMPYLSGEAGNPSLVFLPRPELIIDGYFGRPRSTATPVIPADPVTEPATRPDGDSDPPPRPADAETVPRPALRVGDWSEASAQAIANLPDLHRQLTMIRDRLATRAASGPSDFEVVIGFDPSTGNLTLFDGRPVRASGSERIDLRARYDHARRRLTLPRIGGSSGTVVSIRFDGADPVLRIGESRIRVRPPDGDPPDGSSAPPDGTPVPPEGAPPPRGAAPVEGSGPEGAAATSGVMVEGMTLSLIRNILDPPETHARLSRLGTALEMLAMLARDQSEPFAVTVGIDPANGRLGAGTSANPVDASDGPRILIRGRYDPNTRALTLPFIPDAPNAARQDIRIRFSGENPEIQIGDQVFPVYRPTPVLAVGDEVAVIEHDSNGIRRGRHMAIVPGIGEVGAFTHEGVSKHSPARNEDTYAFALGDGEFLVLVGDGMGGEGNQRLTPGETASGTAARTILDMFSGSGFDLGRAFQSAHETIRSEGHGGATVATALLIRPDGSGRIAYTGDTRCFIARRGPNGSYAVYEAYLPYSWVGAMRMSHGARPGFDTLTMHSHPFSSRVMSGLGHRETPPVAEFWDGSTPRQIIVQDLSILIPGTRGEWIRNPYRLQPGDLTMLMTDGVAELFNRDQMAETLRGRTRIEEILGGLESETGARLDLFRSLTTRFAPESRLAIPSGPHQGRFVDAEGGVWSAETGGSRVAIVPVDGDIATLLGNRRSPITEGSFSGNFIDPDGDIWNALQMGTQVGHVGPDNVGLAVFRFDPTAARTVSTSIESE